MHLSILLSLLALWFGTLDIDGKNSDSDEACGIGDTNLRLQFLGGYSDPTNSSDECYVYRIHSHYKSDGSENENSECEFIINLSGKTEQSLQRSLQICNGSYDLSNYLKSVSLGNEQDSYFIDENNFHYQINDVNDHLNVDRNNNTNNSGIVTLCFHDDNVEETVKFVAKTQYCFDYEITNNNNNNGVSINVCSNRGVFITDVCGLDSPIRHKKGSPHTGIDFVPQKYKTNKLGQKLLLYYIILQIN